MWRGARFVDGYPKIWHNGSNRRAVRVLLGIAEAKLCALHHCDEPLCVNTEHIYLGTRSQNSADKVSRNRHVVPVVKSGERHPMAKLTDDDVLSLRELYNDGVRSSDLAELFSISRSHASGLATGRLR